MLNENDIVKFIATLNQITTKGLIALGLLVALFALIKF